MIDYELTDLLIELEEIQQNQSFNLARGQQVADLLDFYEIPPELYSLKQEPANGRPPEQCRRKIACFNFGLVTPAHQKRLIECLFMIGHSPEFIAEALGEDIRYIAETLSKMVEDNRAQKAAELRKNPQRFRLVKA
ncbi:MAG: hypothetical protein MI976_05945 [Pseudomonadales bacterium]|nr:hypothetical protein [Pseudomonadales bacterium]